MITSLAPRMASKVRRIRCSRAWTSTWMVTPGGIKSCSIRVRRISYSVSEEAGNPTSISRKPMEVSIWKNSTFCSRFMGLTRAWLPSRRSTLHHTGALQRTWSGQVLFCSPMGTKGLYLRYPWFIQGSLLSTHGFPFPSNWPSQQKAPGTTLSCPGRKSFRGTTRIRRENPPSSSLLKGS